MSIFNPREGQAEGESAGRGRSGGAYPGMREGYPGQYGPGAAQGEDDEIDLRGLLLTVWRRKWIVVISAGFAGLLGVLVAAQMTPVYTSSARVLFAPERMNVIDLQEVLVNSQSRDQMQNQIEILRSTSLLERVVERLDLGSTPEFNPALRTGPPSLGERLSAQIGAVSAWVRRTLTDLGVMAPPPDRGSASVDPQSRAERARLAYVARLRAGLRLRTVPGTRVIDIAYTSTDPRLPTRIVNAVADAYIDQQVEAKIEATRSATDWLSQRVTELQERVRKAEDAIAEARKELSIKAGQGGAPRAGARTDPRRHHRSRAPVPRAAVSPGHRRRA